MNTLKTMSVSLAMLLGAGTLTISSASASPLANFNTKIQEPGSNIELVQERKWRYDRNRHGNRRSKRDRDHRFFFSGFWYAAPFWTYGLSINDRLSCAEARRIVDRRFNRVRTIECRGAVYTFRALNRRGRPVIVSINSRTGGYW
jgi:hypothetical protein